MKITRPTLDDTGLEAVVSDHQGRSALVTIVNTVMDEVHSVRNRGQQFGGLQPPAEVVADAATDLILCSNLRQIALKYFREREIGVYTGASDKVHDIMQAYRSGKLQKATETNSCPGTGS